MAAEETPAEMEPRLHAEITAQVAAQTERDRQLREEQEAQRSLRDITAPRVDYNFEGSIVVPQDAPPDFQIPPHFITLVSQHQFGGSANEDVHGHLERFTRHCSTLRRNVNLDTIRLMLFPFSLRDTAEEWLRTQPLKSITSWDDLAEKFTTKFFPYNHIRKLKQEINSFIQLDSENLYETWERFKRLLMKCPGHNISTADQVEKFYAALNDYTRDKLDTAASGAFDALPTQPALDIINNLAARAAHSNNDRQNRKGDYEVETLDAVLASNKKLAQKVDAMVKRLEGGQRNAEDAEFDEEVKAMGSYQNDTYSNTYNPGWRNHPNFSWRDQNNSGDAGGSKQFPNQRQYQLNQRPPPPQNQGNGKKSLEEIVADLALTNQSFMNETRGTFPSDTLINPKDSKSENCSAVTLRSGKTLNEIEELVEKKSVELEKVVEKEKEGTKSEEAVKNKESKDSFPEKITCKRKLPQKFKDPGSFTIPVDIEGLSGAKALCDLGASINLMPLSMFKKLNMGEATPTLMSLQLADRSIKHPYGIAEDVLVRVDKFIFPVDFVILDIEEDSRVPLILGRPFLATGNAKINVAKGLLSLKVGDEKVKFSVFRTLKHPNCEDVFSCEVIDESVCEEFAKISGKAASEVKKDNYELNPTLIKLVGEHQYGGSATENFHAHMVRFHQFSSTVRIKDVSDDAFRLRLFPYSLKGEAKVWFQSQPQGSIVTWEDLVEKFGTKFLPCSCKSLRKCDSNPS
ncbi:uncharacterized protein LOC130719681 [Lotus japonicus]|uniref:uncharacterized protein LOC130719681 n=1 Tax=Lotus japonicus TaxID=34305 RepID=UPI002587BBBE|nr:uncharacterized protein LOC130719681 [Lotus japonicus]